MPEVPGAGDREFHKTAADPFAPGRRIDGERAEQERGPSARRDVPEPNGSDQPTSDASREGQTGRRLATSAQTLRGLQDARPPHSPVEQGFAGGGIAWLFVRKSNHRSSLIVARPNGGPCDAGHMLPQLLPRSVVLDSITQRNGCMLVF